MIGISTVLSLPFSYPEIGDDNSKGTLWTFKQWLAWKIRVHYVISTNALIEGTFGIRYRFTFADPGFPRGVALSYSLA